MVQPMPLSQSPDPNAADNSANRGPALLAGGTTLLVAASIAVTLRLVARRIKKVSWAADDYLAVLSLVLAYAMFIAMIFCIKHGLGQKRPKSIPDALQASKWLYIWEVLFPVTTIATKLSILYLYKRIFSVFNKTFAWALYLVGALQVTLAVSAFFSTVFQCWPINMLWTLDGGLYTGDSESAGHCINVIASLTGLAVINLVLNTALLVLPLPMVWSLHTSQKQKIALTFIFALGGADVLTSIPRTYLISRGINDGYALYRQAPAVILSFVEPCVGIICACLPVMRPLLYATKGLVSGFLSPPSDTSWIRLRGRSSSSPEVNGSAKSSDAQVSWKASKATHVMTPEDGRSYNSKQRWMDVEQGQGITVKTELNQSSIRNGCGNN